MERYFIERCFMVRYLKKIRYIFKRYFMKDTLLKNIMK